MYGQLRNIVIHNNSIIMAEIYTFNTYTVIWLAHVWMNSYAPFKYFYQLQVGKSLLPDGIYVNNIFKLE